MGNVQFQQKASYRNKTKPGQGRKKRRSRKGEVSINNAQGMIVLRWSYQGRYSLSMGFTYKAAHLPYARKLAKRIQADMLQGTFDHTLTAYGKQQKKVNSAVPRAFTTGKHEVHLKPDAKLTPVVSSPQPVELVVGSPGICFIHELYDLFGTWVTDIRKRSFEKSASLKSMRAKLGKWAHVPLMDFARLLKAENLSERTENDYLYNYRTFLDWCLHIQKISYNPLYQVMKSRTLREATPEERKPLDGEQIGAVLNAVKNNDFGRHHSRYYPFLYFIFSTGVRNAEAVGLRISHVNFKERSITICEALARGEHGSHSKARIRKETKTGNTRILPMNDQLYEVLWPLCQGRGGDELVFISASGGCIDDAHVLRSVFAKVLEGLKISYRVLYVARKSMATRAIKEGMNVTDLAYYLGHNTIETAMRFYIAVERSTVPLPVV